MNRRDLQSNLAMTMTLVMGSMLFATLFMAYALYRSSSAFWPPMGMSKVELGLPTLSTLLIIVSSWFCYQTKMHVKESQLDRARFNLNITMSLGLAFMVAQGVLWAHLKNTGVYVTSGIFPSIIYGFTWIHAAHVVMGLGALIYLKVVLRPSTKNLLTKTHNIEKFWHFLGVIWMIMYLTIFVL